MFIIYLLSVYLTPIIYLPITCLSSVYIIHLLALHLPICLFQPLSLSSLGERGRGAVISCQPVVMASKRFVISACWELQGPDQLWLSPLTDYMGLGVPQEEQLLLRHLLPRNHSPLQADTRSSDFLISRFHFCLNGDMSQTLPSKLTWSSISAMAAMILHIHVDENTQAY